MSFDASPPTGPAATQRLRSAADLVAAIPYLLGFHPADSLVLISTRSAGQLGVDFTLRVDLPPPSAVADLAEELAEVVCAQRCEEMLLVVVGADPRVEVAPDRPPPRAELVAAVVEACAAAGALAWATIWVAELAADAPWRCYGACGCAGELSDPACSPVAAAAVVAGQVTYADRAELERVVAPGNPAVLRRREALLNRRMEELCLAGSGFAAGPEELATLERWIDVAAVDRPQLRDEDVVRLCLALSDPMVRDAAFGFAFEARAGAAERLWGTLVTESPDPEAAEAAVLLAHSALMRGDGALAGVALRRAQEAWPGHPLSAMVQSALQSGCGPDELRDWFIEGSQRATEELAGRAES